VKRAGAQLTVGGVKRALIGAVFDAAEEVVIGRVRFEHHRRATAGGMADHQAWAVLLFKQLARLCIGFAVVDQLLDHGFKQVDLHGLKVGAHRGVFGVLLRQRCQQRLEREDDGLFIELTHLVVGLAFPLRQAGEFFIQPLFQRRNISVKTLALGFRQLRKLGLVQRLAFEHRGEGDVGVVAVQRDVLFQRKTLNDIEGAVVALIEGAVDRALLLLVGRMFEHRRKRRQQVVDQSVDVGDESAGAAGRQFQGARLTGVVEIVDVHPVRRRLHALGFGLEVALDEGKAPGAGLAHHEDVVAGARHSDAELQGFDRSFLAEHAAKGFQIVGCREAELFSGKGTGQRFGRESQAGSNRIGHRTSLHQAGQMGAFWRSPHRTGKA
jgi:hypothetical protein